MEPCLAARRAWIVAEKVLVSLRYPLLRGQVPVPSHIHAWVLGHPRLGNALYNAVRPVSASSWAGLGCSVPAAPALEPAVDGQIG